MNKVFIVCQRFLDEKRKNVSIGGIQTYVYNLCGVVADLNYAPVVVQQANEDYECVFQEIIKVIGVDVSNETHFRKRRDKLHGCVKGLAQKEDVVIFATEGYAMPIKGIYSIAIQHGISWDITSESPISTSKNIIHILRQSLEAVLLTSYVSRVDHVVCVDYNYVNWYRTQIKHVAMDYTVIPNFAKVLDLGDKQDDGIIRIIFARRFQVYRGTRLFCQSITNILSLYKNIEVTIAGEGPDEKYLRDALGKFENVKFIKFNSEESLQIHHQHDIAVVPTLGSEGTSLSLLEAMAAGCAVICTDVGGLTNIVTNKYNGLMINPKEDKLTKALKILIEDDAFRYKIAQRGYEMVRECYSFDRWAKQWREVLEESKTKHL